MVNLPSLKSIEAFEAAARSLNFTQAGHELNVTSAAVSQRVSALEEHLGFRLFKRSGPKLELTEMGELCLPEISRSLIQMRDSFETLHNLKHQQVLTIKVSPSFASKWLIPRLDRFHQAHGDIDVRVWATTDTVNISEGESSIAVYYGAELANGNSGRLVMDHLFAEQVIPVCAPSLSLQSPQDLAHHTLLHDETMRRMQTFPDWRKWLEASNVLGADPNRGPRFRVSSMAIQAAIEGQGICLGRSVLVQDDITHGRLVSPFTYVYPESFDYFLVYPRAFSGQPNFSIFRDWLLRETALHTQQASLNSVKSETP